MWQIRAHAPIARGTITSMTEDLHAQANAEQIRVLREALGEGVPTGPALEIAAGEATTGTAPAGDDAEVGVS